MTDNEFEDKFLTHRKAAINFFKSKYSLTSDEAEDMVQNAYLKIYKRFKDQNVNCEYPKKYLFDTIKNCIYEHKTRKKHVQNEECFSEINVEFVDTFIDLISEIDYENTPQNTLEKIIVSDELRHLISQLSTDTLEAFKLYYYDDLQANEVAVILNLPLNTLKTRLFRGRQKLRSLIKEDMLVSTP